MRSRSLSDILRLGSLCLLAFHAAPAPATDTPARPPPRGSLDAGAPPAARFALTPTLMYGGRLDARFFDENAYNLADEAPTHGTVLQPVGASLALLWQPGQRFSVYTNLKLETFAVLRENGLDIDGDPRLRLDKLYADWTSARHDLLVRVGRQRVKDKREWLIDDTLDGITLRHLYRSVVLEAGLWRERAFAEDLLSRDRAVKTDNFRLNLKGQHREDMHYAAYLFGQHDRQRDERALWLGVQMGGEWRDLDYWGNLALVGGNRRGRDVRGVGFDFGGIYRLRKHPRIYAIGGLAYGSGDDRSADLGFRQTGLQDNTAKLGGVTRMQYYGEVFDPELANMWILTAGIGIRPIRDLSFNLVWHGFRQDVALDELRDSDLDAEPDGDSRHLGQELDLVVGYRQNRRFKLEAVLGRFLPGSAFSEDSTPATLVKLEARYNF